MSIFLSDATTLPAEQQAIWDKCFHPTGEYIDLEKEQLESCVPDHFEEQVRRYPNRLAVKSRSHQLSYQELNQAANRVRPGPFWRCIPKEKNQSPSCWTRAHRC